MLKEGIHSWQTMFCIRPTCPDRSGPPPAVCCLVGMASHNVSRKTATVVASDEAADALVGGAKGKAQHKRPEGGQKNDQTQQPGQHISGVE